MILAGQRKLLFNNERFRSLLGDDLIFMNLVLSEENLCQRIEMRHPGNSNLQEISRVCPSQIGIKVKLTKTYNC